ncbi:MAG: hypothetical protein J7M29_10570 [Verrucomicrobia bacterium]|nr:hypothetical protein [Verrucomicrobiota bacterium]
MARTNRRLTEVICKTKHPFRQTDARPKKPEKNRYERRKVREFLRMGTYAGDFPS